MFKRMIEPDVKETLQIVYKQIEEACSKRSPELQVLKPTLVAVSKTKSIDLIVSAYEAGQRNFGENYVPELEEKAKSSTILDKCKEIQWHFIGRLQSNKMNKLLCLPNLYMIETVNSQKLASQLNKNWSKFGSLNQKLNVMVQVNTSNEEEKNGINPLEVCDVTKFVINECENLNFSGLMTIGKFGYDLSQGPNPDFICLKECKERICKELNLDFATVQLSMGMSDDFEHAIELGSTNVRVGSSIFGLRPKK